MCIADKHLMNRELWQAFEETGDIDFYMMYKNNLRSGNGNENGSYFDNTVRSMHNEVTYSSAAERV